VGVGDGEGDGLRVGDGVGDADDRVGDGLGTTPVHGPPLSLQLVGSARPPPSVTRKPMVALAPAAIELPASGVAVNEPPFWLTLAPHQFWSRSPAGRLNVSVHDVTADAVPLASVYWPWKNEPGHSWIRW
jgi:hypothetical protein